MKLVTLHVVVQFASAYDDHSPRKWYREVGSIVKDLLVTANRCAEQV